MTASIELLVVGWLPGFVLFHLPFGGRQRRAALPAEERAYWAVILSIAISLSLVLGLAAAHRYSFRRLLIADLLLAAAAAAAARFDLRLGPSRRRAGPAAVLPVALVVFAAWHFLPPSEYIIGGKDPGVYVNEGVQLAQRGAVVVHDPVIAHVPAFARDLFLPRDRNRERFVAARFMGFYILDPDSGAVVSQFPHLYPASIAIGYAVDGLSGARYALVFWAVLGVASVYFLGARLVGQPAAAATACLLAMNVVQLWFARYPNADMAMQALLFAALLASARAHTDDQPFFSPVAGALLGLLLFLRFDAVIAVAAVVCGLLLGFVARQRLRWTFFAPLTIAALLDGWYLAGPMREYFELPRVFLANLHLWQYGVLTAGAALVLLTAVYGRRSERFSSAVVAGLPIVLTAAVLLLAVYALAFRHPGGKLTDYDAYSLRIFASFYVTLPAVIAALIGFALVTRHLFWRDPAFLITFTAFAAFFFYKIRIVPDHFWMARHYVPIILPGTLLLASAAALTGVRGRIILTRAIRGPIGAIFLILLAGHYLRAAQPVAQHVEYAGIIPRLEALAGRVGDRDLLVVESRDAGSDVHVFALPLAYIYARNVLVLSSAAPDKTTFAAFLNEAHARYDRVLFLGGGGTDLLSSRWSVAPIVSDRFQIPEYDAPRNAYPRYVRHKEFDYTLYAFSPPRPAAAGTAFDLGIDDDLNVVRFHAKEKTGGRTFRWTERQSFVIVEHIAAPDRTLSLWMSNGGRPPAAGPADVDVLLAGQFLGTVRVANGFSEYRVAIPANVAATAAATGEPVRITLRTTTWNPMKMLGTGDDRDLGVMVARVAVN